MFGFYLVVVGELVELLFESCDVLLDPGIDTGELFFAEGPV